METKTHGTGLRLRTDLHTHSVYSDGYYTPDELCRRAKNNGVELLSVTDHDTMNGDEEKRAAAEKYGLLYVSGWEVSAYAGRSKIHITGYGCKQNAAYLSFMRERKELALERAADSIEKLRGAGIPNRPFIPCILRGLPQRLREKHRGRFMRNTLLRAKSLIPSWGDLRPNRRSTVFTLRAASLRSRIRDGSRWDSRSGKE